MPSANTCMDGWLLRRYALLANKLVFIQFFRFLFHGGDVEVANLQDVDGWNKGSHKLLVEHLRANGDLKCLPEIVKELELTAQQQVQNLKKVVINKDDVLQVTHRENWSLTNKVDLVTAQREQAESEKLKLIENHKKGKVLRFFSWIRATSFSIVAICGAHC